MDNRHSPLPVQPLHNPGESLSERRIDILADSIPWFILIGVTAILALIEWLRWLYNNPPNPVVFTGLALITLSLAMIRILSLWKSHKNYYLGMQGEKYVAQVLNADLRDRGYYTLHDIPCERMNIDHVLIGPGGIFTIETKVARKIEGVESKIVQNIFGLFVYGYSPGWIKKALWQAKTEANNLDQILNTESIAHPKVIPIVFYPGWDVEDDCIDEVWILNEKTLQKKIESLPAILSIEEITLLRNNLEKYVRESDA